MIPKPQFCSQGWLEMEKVEGGRLCGECQKVMTDFTKMKWAEIEKIHSNSKEPVCGMYSKKQLDHWGNEVPSFFSRCSKSAIIVSSIFSALNFHHVEAKPINISNDGIFISPFEIDSLLREKMDTTNIQIVSIFGIVFDDDTGLPLNNAYIGFTKNSDLWANTDESGQFTIEGIEYNKLVGSEIVAKYPDYKSYKIKLYPTEENKLSLKFFLSKGKTVSHTIAFGIAVPTSKQKVKGWWKRLFKRKSKN